ncbi:MAG: primosomal protein N' [Phycisphaerales bacterium]|nr:primosomal protein N' [Phycisphaerales bacterium]MCB9862162.1 primosomal protein N' [Phycisphaerales bacterium]
MASRADRATPSLLDPPTLRTAIVADVALLRRVDRVYSYRVPPEFAGQVRPGMRVRVPFGRSDKPVDGYCLNVSEAEWKSTLKPVLECIDAEPLLSPSMVELGRWLATYYAAPLGRTLDLMVPAAVKRGAGVRHTRVARLIDGDYDVNALKGKQKALAVAIRDGASPVAVDEACRMAGCTAAVAKTLERKGVIAIDSIDAPDSTAMRTDAPHDPAFELNPSQQAAIDQIDAAIDAAEFSVQVLFGVTGSGKTEVYIRAIRRAIEQGKQGIMLVPEIALTTQTVDRLAKRFDCVATMHSGATDAERARAWRAIASGAAHVVIGTRSAIFAPCPNLGVIIVDEEQEPSYKSQSAPRYHTRDVAVKLAHLHGIPVVLGSATPSLETWLNVHRRKHYKLIRLPERVRGLAMPQVHLVDMNEEHRFRPGVHMMSREMEARLSETLERKEQAVLLLNRRGYASYVHCPKCRNVLRCKHCDVNLVYHASTDKMQCHYCRERRNIPYACSTIGCDGKPVKFGLGTERVEEELARKFPDVKARRIDSDSMTRAGDYSEILGAFERREFDVLIGTQMVAKGLDFPFVSFVGVISADTALAFDDFRAEERTFQLVLQVSGRSGRGDAPGQVVVQTFAAETAPIRHAVAGNYEAFANGELKLRLDAGLPPYTRMLRIVVADKQIAKARRATESIVQETRTLLAKHGVQTKITPAQEAPIQRLRGMHRFETTLIFSTATTLMDGVRILKDEGVLRAKADRVMVDVDPISLQ